MRSLLIPTVLAVLALGPAAPSYAGSPIDETGHGETATVVATSGTVTGTPGPAVVVASGAGTRVDTGDGDDLVCEDGVAAVDTGAGDDRVFHDPRPGGASSDLDLGSGRDTLHVQLPVVVRVDLARGTVQVRSVVSRLRHAEDVVVSARRVRVRGDDGANRLFVNGCVIDVRAGAGADRLHDGYYGGCSSHHVRLAGGAGPDVLTGSGEPDVLIGGPGRDVARGGGGVDRCRAEKMSSCER